MHSDAERTALYWLLVSVLCLFGFLGMFSIGAPFLLLGIALGVVAPWRTRRTVLWPTVSAVVAFVVGYILVAPLGCTTSLSSEFAAQRTTCNNALGIEYSGPGLYNPSLLPALLAGLALSVVAGVTVWFVLRRRARR